ncbi:thioredoxin [Natronomonas pharaonis DSM 2160]|uniref:Thioredoxin n=1 Tax=Natronomonas pharaonis (strain ATCC 35678 / DSM 2160 / CIP 103997 / JCM 8858 / NBRC 14720 / NCIMB 2260 / Gabara) TaxID=348780 RepID=A0A1U7EX05_NATPD|nr:thioredoxin [Natronomonas pharaonis]CAI49648.1 thioredoxin [Natronomonas pharaonis DSM 2160]
MELETMRPNPAWDADAYAETVATFESLADDIVVKVWGGDWCKDCRSQLPDFGAALEAAGVDDIEHYPVEKADDGSKHGPKVDEYDIEYIPTVVVEDADSGTELARFIEEEPEPIAVYLAEQLSE